MKLTSDKIQEIAKAYWKNLDVAANQGHVLDRQVESFAVLLTVIEWLGDERDKSGQKEYMQVSSPILHPVERLGCSENLKRELLSHGAVNLEDVESYEVAWGVGNARDRWCICLWINGERVTTDLKSREFEELENMMMESLGRRLSPHREDPLK